MMKLVVKVTLTFKEAKELDQLNGNTLWGFYIKKRMENSGVLFQLLSKEDILMVGYKETTCHFIFDVKMNLTRKDNYVADGHLMDSTYSMTYTRVIS